MSNKVVFILGTGHCGSTLIDLVFGSHPEISSLGEVNRLNGQNLKNKRDFWTEDLVKKISKHFRYQNNRIISYDFHKFPSSKIFENRTNLYEAIFESDETKVLIDSSKNLYWIKRGVSHLLDSNIKPFVIHLKREPCAVANSYYRKYKQNKDFSGVVDDVKERIKKNNQYYEDLKGVDKLILNYEVFCKDPAHEIQNVCKVLDIEYTSKMLKYWEAKHYNISGNSGTNSLIDLYQGKEVNLHKKRNDRGYYETHPLEIKLDERWKNELNQNQIEMVNKKIPVY